jgi:transposase
MAARFVTVDHDTPLLLAPDLRDWVAEDHMVHFIMDAVGLLNLDQAHINHGGTGSAQYPPAMMLGLLIYCYATGSFSSRKIERLTYDSVAVRFLCADTHPDHDSICKFRTDNEALLTSSFNQVLECAALAKVLKVGSITLALDGTKILANASKHSAISHGHAIEQMQLLELEVEQLLQKARDADSTPLQDGLSVPEEVKRRTDRLAKMKEAVKVIEERAKARHKDELADYTAKMQRRAAKEDATGKKPGGHAPKPPKEEPRGNDQFNFTDPESRIMKAGSGEHFEQSYNAQAAVEIESRLIIAQHVTEAPNDKQQLEPTLAALSPVIESVETVLVDSGYYSESAVRNIEESSPQQQEALSNTTVLAATKRQRHGRSVAELEKREDPPAPPPGASMSEVMAQRLETQAGKELYGQRKQTIEPVFGIIKSTMGFRQFMLRGKAKANLEWTLVTLSYNLKRLFHMRAQLAPTA